MDYVELFQKSAMASLPAATTFSAMFLVLGRIMPIVGLAPFFGAKVLPRPAKVTICFALMIMVLPKVMTTVTEPLHFDARLLMLMLKEIFIGTILGFFVSLPFLIVSSAGLIIDHQRGAASLMTNDPTIQNQSSPIGTLLNFMLIVLFYAYEGPFYVIDALFGSFDIVPVTNFLNPLFFVSDSPLHVRLEGTMEHFVEMMLKFAMPGLLVILMTDTFLGIINRLAPQVQITFLGMGLKSWLAIFIVCVGWSPMVDQMGKEIVVWLRDFVKIINEFAVGELPKLTPTP